MTKSVNRPENNSACTSAADGKLNIKCPKNKQKPKTAPASAHF